jgi:hypothetical protein
MRLAVSEQERLWKGLERFVNCGSDLSEYLALGKAFNSFWPQEVIYFPKSEEAVNSIEVGAALRPTLPTMWPTLPAESDELDEQGRLDWNPICHQLFLVYRDSLRALWQRDKGADHHRLPEFLVGLSDFNQDAGKNARRGVVPIPSSYPLNLQWAWRQIVLSAPAKNGAVIAGVGRGQ